MPSLIAASTDEDSLLPRCRQLLIEFRKSLVAETRDLDEDTQLDVDAAGRICGITIEHASVRADIPSFSDEQVAA